MLHTYWPIQLNWKENNLENLSKSGAGWGMMEKQHIFAFGLEETGGMVVKNTSLGVRPIVWVPPLSSCVTLG